MNKKMKMLGLILMVALVLVGCSKDKQNNKSELENLLKEMGKDFYENLYYDKVKTDENERKTFLRLHETDGIKVDLYNLGIYNNRANAEKVEKFVNGVTNEACDNTKTRVIIYPVSPYEKQDYRLEVELVCGFED